MNRPVMNPSFALDAPSSPGGSDPRSWPRHVLRALAWLLSLLLADIRLWKRRNLRVDDGTSRLGRAMRGIAYRLMLAPLLMVALAIVLVWIGTHPQLTMGVGDPLSQGIYYDPVTLLSADGARLDAWLIPALDARRIVAEREMAIVQKYPAVVLVHDLGQTREQMLPLVRPLHDAGFVVCVTALRSDNGVMGATFGLNEAMDVRAAVEMLRRRSYVRADAIAVLGIGAGATACSLAAAHDPAIAAIVLDQPVTRVEDALAARLALDEGPSRWLAPLCRWVFEIGYGLSCDEPAVEMLGGNVDSRGVLVFDERSACTLKPAHAGQIVDFLRSRMQKAPSLLVEHSPGKVRGF